MNKGEISMEQNKRKLVELLIENDILQFGDFTLKSGKKSWFYIDLRLISSFPKTFEYVIKCYLKILNRIDKTDAVAGVAVAGVPFSSVLGYIEKIPSIIVRPQPKGHGTKKIIEGNIPQDANVVLVDDLITTGSSKIPGILALKEQGYRVENMIVLIDRSLSQLEEFEELGVKLLSYITINEIFEECLNIESEKISKETKELIKQNL